MKLLAWLEKIDAAIYKAQKWLLVLLCIAITAINIAQITGRYVFFASIPWSEQLSVVLFLLIIFLGQNLATKADGEIRVDLFAHMPALRRRFLLVADALCLFTVAVFFVSSIYLVIHASQFRQVISSMQLPYVYVFCMMPLGFGLIFLARLTVLLKRWLQRDIERRPS